MAQRSNEEWVAVLGEDGPKRDQAIEDLRPLLVRGLSYALANRAKVREEDLEDFAQDAILRILDSLHSFRGESRFLTWAQKIAVHVAFSELRRHRWRDVSLDELTESEDGEFIPVSLADQSAGPEQQAMRRVVLSTLRRLIREELTPKQRQAMTAVMQGMPLQEVAIHMGTNRNALYKLMHDARQRLQERLMEEGLSPQDVLSAFEP